MEEDKEDDPNTIISFPRGDRDGAGHGTGWGEELIRGWGRGLDGQRSNLDCSDLMAVWIVEKSLAHIF